MDPLYRWYTGGMSAQDYHTHNARLSKDQARADGRARRTEPATPAALGFAPLEVGVAELDTRPEGVTRWRMFTDAEVRACATEHPDPRIRKRAAREVRRRERKAGRS